MRNFMAALALIGVMISGATWATGPDYDSLNEDSWKAVIQGQYSQNQVPPTAQWVWIEDKLNSDSTADNLRALKVLELTLNYGVIESAYVEAIYGRREGHESELVRLLSHIDVEKYKNKLAAILGNLKNERQLSMLIAIGNVSSFEQDTQSLTANKSFTHAEQVRIHNPLTELSKYTTDEFLVIDNDIVYSTIITALAMRTEKNYGFHVFKNDVRDALINVFRNGRIQARRILINLLIERYRHIDVAEPKSAERLEAEKLIALALHDQTGKSAAELSWQLPLARRVFEGMRNESAPIFNKNTLIALRLTRKVLETALPNCETYLTQ